MTAHRTAVRPPRGDVVLPPPQEVTERRLVDAAYFPGGRADALFLPRTEGEVAAVLRGHASVLPIGAQSSLTGGATPTGGALLATDRLDAFEIDEARRVATCGAGVVLAKLQEAARDRGLFLAPAPTFDGATIGGMVATNAAGAATFKHGTTRAAVRALTVVLADGGVLDVERGAVVAHAEGWFEIAFLDGVVRRVPVPTYRMPDVPKCSAGYFAAPGMDLVDLVVGSEGTLGVVVQVVVDLTPRPAASLTCWLPVDDEARGIEIARRLRETSQQTWRTADPRGLDVPAIEHIDRRSLELLREDGEDAKQHLPVDARAALALVFEVALPTPTTSDEALEQLADADGADAPLRRLVRLLGDDAANLEAALPGETSKARSIYALREAVPMCVNHRVRDARLRDPGVQKVAGDFVVPWDRFAESIALYRATFARRGLDHAIWGHISDGNVHPNVLPRNAADVAAGKEALLEIGAAVVRMGGAPLAEHGVGRNPVKQEMVRLLHGDAGVEEMRAVKRALDPAWKLAPSVIFGR
jgi:D-lactate dehydrogenase (cytochrome)